MKGKQFRALELVHLCQENKSVPGTATTRLLLTSYSPELYVLYTRAMSVATQLQGGLQNHDFYFKIFFRFLLCFSKIKI